ncbi:MAG: hypothetical protein A2Z11_01575 [Candidatus Woykebacteria bacterium RBG_16_43_9]|uniref:DUF559 domain-containing protein n=1 Tax=Candidatus Woykebacteria bacterium RBG_16_43_9 TaxID=1802596 RepID=A0A1G1WGX0_9BACT|nr:MAG: hypothetical protein A2Z11_01575 [Candidatus Woykebacteria bacterium RBG_16_43_9]
MSTIRSSHSEILAKQILDHYFGGFRKLDNIRPDWLEGLEIDRFYPTLGVAIEFQGDQHSRIVPGMHQGPGDFRRQIENDTKKQQLLEGKGIRLYQINILDLDRFRVRNLAKRIAEDAKSYTRSKNNLEGLSKLGRIRWDQEPDERLMKRADGLSKVRKTYYRPRKKSWWRRLLRI